VTGVDDGFNNIPQRTTRVTHTVSGSDYDGVVVDDVTVTALDDEEVLEISIRAVEPLVVEGAPVQFRLTATPTPAVDLVVAIAVADPDGILAEAAPTEVMIPANQSTLMFELDTDDDEVDALKVTVTEGTIRVQSEGGGDGDPFTSRLWDRMG